MPRIIHALATAVVLLLVVAFAGLAVESRSNHSGPANVATAPENAPPSIPITTLPPTSLSSVPPPPTGSVSDASQAPAADASQASAADVTWVVEPGNNLWTIASTVLSRSGTAAPTTAEVGSYWAEILHAVHDQLREPRNPHLILPGQTLRFPAPTAHPTGG